MSKTPPPLPKDALKSPPAHVANGEGESPWDTVSSAPAPSAAKPGKGLSMPTWLGRPVLHNDHAQELELNSAVNEFGLKMPRQQAEDEAYKGYIRDQRVSAQAHHLDGMKAALGAGDNEAARRHHMMYSLHAKAMGHEPIGAPHPDVASLLGGRGGQKVYKFKAHKGDAFAVQPPPGPEAGMPYQPGSGVFSSTPAPSPLGKAERAWMYLLHKAGSVVLAKALGEPHYDDHNASKCGSFTCSDCKRKMPSCRGGEGTECDDCWSKKQPKEKESAGGSAPHKEGGGKVLQFKKDEMPAKKPHCKCEAYKFPHRHGGGYCRQKKP